MDLYCPNCDAQIETAEVNISADIAKCSNCNSLHKVSNLMQDSTPIQGSIALTPVEEEVSMAPPRYSEIMLGTEDQSVIEFRTPRKGFVGPHLFIGGFATFWLAFVTVWTVGASFASIFFAMFSIPFWIVGVGLMSSFINTALGIEIIRFEEDELVLIKKQPIRPKEIRIRYEEIDLVSKGKVKINALFPTNLNANHATTEKGKRGELIGPSITMGVKQESFFTGVTDQEMDWIVKVVKKVVAKKKQERAYFG